MFSSGRTSKSLNFVVTVFCFLSFAFLLSLQTKIAHAQDAQRSTLKTVVLDPGHGGKDPGALGAKSRESNIVLDVALRVGKKINEKYPEVEVVYTRKTDVFIDLYKRGDIANKANADLFISIHANSVAKGSRCPQGTATFVLGNDRSAANMEIVKRENAAILFEDDYSTRYQGFDPNRAESYIIFDLMQFSYLNQSLNFASEIQAQFKNSSKRVDRGVHQGKFIVLWGTAMPSVLVEIGFICHAEEEKYMNSAAGKDQLATAIFQAFSSYKSKFDERSSYDTTNGQNQSKPAADSNKVESKPTTAKNIEPKPTTSNKVEFCIQILSSSTPREPSPKNFKKYTNVERFQVSDKFYKYIVFRTPDYATAQEHLKKVKADFSDAFIVCIVDGKIVPAAEGVKLITE